MPPSSRAHFSCPLRTAKDDWDEADYEALENGHGKDTESFLAKPMPPVVGKDHDAWRYMEVEAIGLG